MIFDFLKFIIIFAVDFLKFIRSVTRDGRKPDFFWGARHPTVGGISIHFRTTKLQKKIDNSKFNLKKINELKIRYYVF